MANGHNGHDEVSMPALNSTTSEPDSGKKSSELFCQINYPEDVGAIVTSFCRVDSDSGEVKKEHLIGDPTLAAKPFNHDLQDEPAPDVNVPETKKEPLLEAADASQEPKDIIVSIKDETSRSSSEEEEIDDDEESKLVEYETIAAQKKEEVKDDEDMPLKTNGACIKTKLKNNESDEDEEEDDEDEDEEDEEDSEPSITRSTLRPRSARNDKDRQHRELARQISRIVRKTENDDELTKEEEVLLAKNPKLFDDIIRRHKKRKTTELRKQEIEDKPTVLAKKCERMARAIQKAKYLLVYTGAGISTAANIPDYRGPNGVWTCLDEGREIATCDLARAEPTYTHMALFTLFKKGKLKHIVSQNCDGLHLRSGIPRYSLSEVHGNMFIEVCKHCKPMRPYLRLFDVTERTSKNKHNTMRRCHICGNSLIDTIVHFGERGSIKWPINWDGASKAAEKADVIICLGSSLKVLRRYPWLWCMDRPKKHRPKLYIVNLQWTPKDSAATCKLNGKCDDVMRRVMAYLEIEVPTYFAGNDPLLTYATPLHPNEEHTTTRKELIGAVKPPPEEAEEGSSNDSDIKSWSLDHSYLPPNDTEKKSKPGSKGKLVKSRKLDYKTIMWPRDALYISYKEENFEYVIDAEAQGEPPFYCDCCDPARQKKKRGSDSDEEEDEEDGDNDPSDDDENEEDKASTTSSSVDMTRTEPEALSDKRSVQPGWFGKGRRKKARC